MTLPRGGGEFESVVILVDDFSGLGEVSDFVDHGAEFTDEGEAGEFAGVDESGGGRDYEGGDTFDFGFGALGGRDEPGDFE